MSSWCSWSCRCSWCSWSPAPNSCCSRAPRNRPRAARQRDGVRGERGVAGPRRGRIRPPGPASRANVLLRGAGCSPDTREKASPKPHGKAAVAMKRSISYLYTFINRHGAGGALSGRVPGLPACRSLCGLYGDQRGARTDRLPGAAPHPRGAGLRAQTAPGGGVLPAHSRILLFLCPVSLVTYLNSSEY